jgi:lipopolysaccharide biosynthesis glycosyltransferase
MESNIPVRIPKNQNNPDGEFLCVFDQNYIYPFLVSVFSLKNSSKKLKKLFIACNYQMIPNKQRDTIEKYCNILGIEIGFLEIELGADLPVSKGFNTTTYAKLYAISQMRDTFVYFDVDMIFVNEIDSIWDLKYQPEQDQLLSARPDPGINYSGSRNQAILNSNGFYFNAGLMIINPIKWITGGYERDFPRAISNYSSYGFEWLDQCIFNYLVAGNFKILPSKFNHFVGEKSCEIDEISIFHFAGSHKKPWRVPLGFLHRYLYLRRKIFTKPYKDYANVERRMLKLVRTQDVILFREFLNFRKMEFSKSPHLIDLFLYKFEMRRYGAFIRYIHRIFTSQRT